MMRTRRHIGGCISALEMALCVGLDQYLPEKTGNLVSPGHCWRMIDAAPHLLSAELFAHFRMRAAFSLMTNVAGPLTDTGMPALAGEEDEDVRSAIIGLSLAQARWSEVGAEDQPMRVDLPAEHMEELSWTVGGLLARMLLPMEIVPGMRLIGAIDDVVQQQLSTYDEQTGPIARASLLARSVHAQITMDRLEDLARSGQFLLLAGIIAERTGLDTGVVAQAVVEHDDPAILVALCRVAGLSLQICGLTALALRSVRGDYDDGQIAVLADRFETMPHEEADAFVSSLAVSASLSSMLARLAS